MDSALIVFVVIFIAVAMGGGFFLRQKRAKQAREFAESRGWRHEKSDLGVLDTYPQLFPLNGGDSIESGRNLDARDVIYLSSGEYSGHSFTCYFESQSKDSDGNSTTQKDNWHVVGLQLPVPFPNVTIRRRRKLDRLENKFNKPLEFPMEDLNAAYTIRSEHPPAAMDIITPDTARWLIDQELKNPIVLQDHHLFTYAKGHQKVEAIDPMLAVLTGFLGRIPQQAWQKAQGEYPRPERKRTVPVNLERIVDAVRGYRETRD